MATQKACKDCKMVFEGSSCPNCSSKEYTESFKGKVAVLNSDQSEIAQRLKITKKGVFAVKLG